MIKGFKFFVLNAVALILIFSFNKCEATSVSCIGDSLMVGAKPYLEQWLPGIHVNAELGRHLYEGVEEASYMGNNNLLGDVVVISLGTNGPLYEDDMNNMLSILGSGKHIIWLNNYCPELEWQDSNNAYLNAVASAYPNFLVLDWYSYATIYDFIEPDGVHPTEYGYQIYAALIYHAVVNYL